jgi:hypothetical protein
MEAKDPFENFRKELNRNSNWPMVYMFKFIIPSDNIKLALVQAKFSETSVISTKESVNGKYTSITVRETMMSADEIIGKYKEMEGIEGLITL